MNNDLYKKLNFIAKVGASVLFISALFFPLMGRIFHIKDIVSLNEKRELAQFPSVTLELKSLGQFAKGFERFYNDHFAFRESLIFFNNYIKTKYLLSSPNPKVIIGKEDWLFYRGDNISNLTEGYSLSLPFTEEELIRFQQYFEAKRNWLASKGIRYLFVIAPDKQSVYSEYLPDDYLRMSNHLDQLKEHLTNNSDFQILDLRDILIEAKKDRHVYYKSDTHWNEYGAFLAYRHIIKRLAVDFPKLYSPAITDFDVVDEAVRGRDLANMLALGNLIKETAPRLKRATPVLWHSANLNYDLPDKAKINNIPYFATEYADGGKLFRAVVIGDSFASHLVPYLSESFKRAFFIHIWASSADVQKTVIERELPDIVIEEGVERLLKSVLSKPVEQEFVNTGYGDYAKLFSRSSVILARLSPGEGYSGLLPAYQVSKSLQPLENSRILKLHATGNDPIVHLPSFLYPADKQLIAKIDITTQHDTVLQIFYMTANSREYSESKSIKQSINKGRNLLYIPLKQQDLYGRLRLDPGKLPGDYLIHSVEIRAIPRVL